MFADDANLFSSQVNIKNLFNNVNLELKVTLKGFNDFKNKQKSV